MTIHGRLNRTVDLAANDDAGPLHLGFSEEKGSLDARRFAGRVLYELGVFTVGATVQRDTDGWGAGFGNRTNCRVSGMCAMGNTELHLNVGRTGDYSNAIGPDAATQRHSDTDHGWRQRQFEQAHQGLRHLHQAQR